MMGSMLGAGAVPPSGNPAVQSAKSNVSGKPSWTPCSATARGFSPGARVGSPRHPRRTRGIP
eukprot:5611051-Alexandrium_andersonii.AAC.1